MKIAWRANSKCGCASGPPSRQARHAHAFSCAIPSITTPLRPPRSALCMCLRATSSFDIALGEADHRDIVGLHEPVDLLDIRAADLLQQRRRGDRAARAIVEEPHQQRARGDAGSSIQIQLDRADLLFARKPGEDRSHDLLDIALLVTKIVVVGLQDRVQDLELRVSKGKRELFGGLHRFPGHHATPFTGLSFHEDLLMRTALCNTTYQTQPSRRTERATVSSEAGYVSAPG